MSQAKPTLFLVGTGFIGGTLLTSLLEQGKYEIAALSRDEAKANKLKELGVRPVMGSLDDEILAEESEKADVSLFREALADEFVLDLTFWYCLGFGQIIIHAATADDQPSVKSILKGLAQRPKDKAPAIYIHTSGSERLCFPPPRGSKVVVQED